MMKTLITTFALGFITCAMPAMAEVLGNQKKAGTLTVQQAAEMVKKANETPQYHLDLNRLKSIEPDVARELAVPVSQVYLAKHRVTEAIKKSVEEMNDGFQ